MPWDWSYTLVRIPSVKGPVCRKSVSPGNPSCLAGRSQIHVSKLISKKKYVNPSWKKIYSILFCQPLGLYERYHETENTAKWLKDAVETLTMQRSVERAQQQSTTL